ncbi:hypothetical protein [Paenibacillus glucanolyticus]|uniref:hypothetical protein n=1 Tax=Paenibacillus glucanolyticus TaxID=59843 RepID=UPI00096CF745|nr:hypothetical protein [Paenibacillus glucanolyticus]OMF70497.1 hypothetical protein BK142_23780 [Paenibacillus glucanolyticus]
MIVKIESVNNKYVELSADGCGIIDLHLDSAEIVATVISERLRMTSEYYLSSQDIITVDGIPDYEQSIRNELHIMLKDLGA